jgi:UDP-3-O-[3-hydroxymyristoyl] glucosamine N-acyltransferase
VPVGSETIRLAALAAELGRSCEGDGDVEIAGVASLEAAGPGELAFAGSARWAEALAASRASAVIAPAELDTGGRPTIRSPQPRLDFARAARRVAQRTRPAPGVDPSAVVANDAELDPSAAVGPGCCVGAGARVGPGSVLHANVTLYPGVRVGADCELHAACVLREDTVVGDRCVLQPGVVLGADGFGYEVNEEGRFESVPQLGRVVLEDDVELGANTTVDRGALGDTRIGRGSKLDNLVMVAHNCDVGEGVLVTAQAGLAGSVTVERGALILSQAGIVDHLRIGERAYVGPQSGVTRDVEPGERVLGTPAESLDLTRRIWMTLRQLPELRRTVKRLARRGRGADG